MRIPPRAFAWREQDAIGGNATYVVTIAKALASCRNQPFSAIWGLISWCCMPICDCFSFVRLLRHSAPASHSNAEKLADPCR